MYQMGHLWWANYVTPRPEGRHVATVVCPSFLKSSQELARHYDIIACLKNENPKPNLLDMIFKFSNSRKSTENLTKFHLYFRPKPSIKK